MLSFGSAPVTAQIGVYPPQHDSSLLISEMRRRVDLSGRSVLDLCTGSGVVAVAAALHGAVRVTAFDICPDAVRCAVSNAAAAGVAVGPAWAWDAGPDGRLVLDPLCASAPELLKSGGTLLLVQSELAHPRQSLRQLSRCGLRAYIVAAQRIPFGPVLTARARRLEATGAIRAGQRVEQLMRHQSPLPTGLRPVTGVASCGLTANGRGDAGPSGPQAARKPASRRPHRVRRRVRG